MYSVQNKISVSEEAAEHHTAAAEHHIEAAEFHRRAASYYSCGNYQQANEQAQCAQTHGQHAQKLCLLAMTL